MNYNSALYEIIDAASALPIAPIIMAQGQQPPYIVFQVVDARPIHAKTKYPHSDELTVLVAYIGYNLDSLQTEANLVRTAMACPAGFTNAILLNTGQDYLNETDTYILTQTYQLRMAYTPYSASGIGTMIIGSTFTIA